jgi:hypothetical protein
MNTHRDAADMHRDWVTIFIYHDYSAQCQQNKPTVFVIKPNVFIKGKKHVGKYMDKYA